MTFYSSDLSLSPGYNRVHYKFIPLETLQTYKNHEDARELVAYDISYRD
ncbi:hypothetical protein CCP2SC5_90031 [Azospirillaceae bacterium]